MSRDLVSLVKSGLVAELEKLRDQVLELAEPLAEPQLWEKPIDPGNSVGHLILHLTGNLNHFAGAQLGGTGYVREREREFTETKPPAKAELLANLNAAVFMFRKVVEGLSAEQLAAAHPEARLGPVYRALLASVTHFALHRGQMSYIGRLLSR